MTNRQKDILEHSLRVEADTKNLLHVLRELGLPIGEKTFLNALVTIIDGDVVEYYPNSSKFINFANNITGEGFEQFIQVNNLQAIVADVVPNLPYEVDWEKMVVNQNF